MKLTLETAQHKLNLLYREEILLLSFASYHERCTFIYKNREYTSRFSSLCDATFKGKPRSPVTFEKAFALIHEASEGKMKLIDLNPITRNCSILWLETGESFERKYSSNRKNYKGLPRTANERRSKSCIESRKNVNEAAALDKRKQTCLNKYGTENPKQNLDIQKATKQTCMSRYGTENPMQNREVALKSAKRVNNPTVLYHWRTGEELVCQGSYENIYVQYLNKNRIDFEWQVVIKLPSGKTYRVDCRLEDGTYVELKGYSRPDWLDKWNEFITLKLPYLLLGKYEIKKIKNSL